MQSLVKFLKSGSLDSHSQPDSSQLSRQRPSTHDAGWPSGKRGRMSIYMEELPDMPSTEQMFQEERASAMRAWVTAAEKIVAEGKQRFEAEKKELERQRDARIAESKAQAQNNFDREVKTYNEAIKRLGDRLKANGKRLQAECDSNVAAAHQQFQQKLQATNGDEDLRSAEERLARERRRTEEAEVLARMLKSGGQADRGMEQRKRPHEHLCPITMEVMRDPVMILCGDTFERSEITKWFEQNNTCPHCRQQPPTKTMIPNLAVRKMIEDW